MRRFSAIVVLSVSLAGSAWAGQVGPGYYVEDVTFTDTLSVPNSPTITQPRTVVDIPASYGRLVTVTKDSGASTLWFEGVDGIRNVILSTVSGPILIKRTGK